MPDGLFFATHGTSGEIVGTASAIHNPAGGHHHFPFGGEIAYVMVKSEHRGKGLGRALTAAATSRLLRAGYSSIRLGTQDERLPALRVYLGLGFEPFLYAPEIEDRWRSVCEALGRPFTPDLWRTRLGGFRASSSNQ